MARNLDWIGTCSYQQLLGFRLAALGSGFSHNNVDFLQRDLYYYTVGDIELRYQTAFAVLRTDPR